ncbi:MAG: hypothetical protein Q4A09_06955 [Capnocytophaga felis]|nr:hypothetical protein [Capnocytophaga felis]
MKPKIIYLLFLSIGVLVSFVSCGKVRTEYVVNADIVYRNETPHHIRYYKYGVANSVKVLVFEVTPRATFKEKIRQDGGNEILKLEDYEGIFEDFQGNGSNLVEYDNLKCLIYRKGEGSTTGNYLNSFQIKKINDRHYEFTYTFTEEEAQKATACP